ncbi:MAG: sodium ion-translocating decarboxylase subunit beta [Clostridiales bacterium]|nr:sodium ion-translocating decarboxylase subunit beta [Clostridiales bacterium]
MEISKRTLKALIVAVGILLFIKLCAVLPFILSMLPVPNSSNIGIIGGADGPTAIFLSDNVLPPALYILLFFIEALVYIFLLVTLIKAIRKSK